ncbi:protein DYAD [Hevea brasiliensis]|nr:protein DYAD [Hevea brasiliensis]XP_057984423.1 protein DYAD [Hevea brasiliensis]
MSRTYKGASERYESCERQDETTKKGLCLLELRRTGMVQWGVCGPVALVDQCEGDKPQISSSCVKEEQMDDDEAVTAASLVSPKLQKRRRLNLCQLREARAARCLRQGQTDSHKQIKHENPFPCKKDNSSSRKKENFIDRWSKERYKLAEKRMLEVMKAEGAVFEKPISRPVLRVAARKHIPDTGLLDHLLKHIDGKVAPGGSERFRRCYNTQGVMEYWLESADLVKIKHEAGLPDPNWVPPSWWKPGGDVVRESVSAGELTLLKEEVAKLKRDMNELLLKNQEQNRVDSVEEMHKELMKWRSKTDQCLMEISSSLSGMQDMYQELMMWKSKAEQQLMEISNSVSSLQASKQCTTFSPVSERWEDWLESTNLDNIKGEDFTPWLGSTDLVNVGQDAPLQECSALQPWLKSCDSPSRDPICARELELLKEEMAKVKRDVQYLLPKRMEDAQASVTPDSSATNSLKFDLDNPFLLFQEMFKELVKWKAKVEEQMLEISNSVSTLQASKQYAA